MVIPMINLVRTGENIKRLRIENNYSVNDLKEIMGFDNPQAIYKWQWGECLPAIDNLVILARLFNTSIEGILVIEDTDIPFNLFLNYKFNDFYQIV